MIMRKISLARKSLIFLAISLSIVAIIYFIKLKNFDDLTKITLIYLLFFVIILALWVVTKLNNQINLLKKSLVKEQYKTTKFKQDISHKLLETKTQNGALKSGNINETNHRKNIRLEIQTPLQKVTALLQGMIDNRQNFNAEAHCDLATQALKHLNEISVLTTDVSKLTVNKDHPVKSNINICSKSPDTILHNFQPDHKQYNILMIDDDESSQISMGMLLHNNNFNLTTANGGIEGLRFLHSNHCNVDLILLDLMMPDMYGLNVLTEIMNDNNLKHIPVILQSGSSDFAEIDKAKKMGAKKYLRKPYVKNRVLKVIAEVLKG